GPYPSRAGPLSMGKVPAMDAKNRFHTDETWLWVRAEHVALLLTLLVLLALHLPELNWPRFVAALVLIDLIGYLPGAVAYRRATAASPPTGFPASSPTASRGFTWSRWGAFTPRGRRAARCSTPSWGARAAAAGG